MIKIGVLDKKFFSIPWLLIFCPELLKQGDFTSYRCDKWPCSGWGKKVSNFCTDHLILSVHTITCIFEDLIINFNFVSGSDILLHWFRTVLS